MRGIDVSSHQGLIDWNKVKSQVDFAIIRLGYGDNVERQDDSQFINNVNGCISNRIPFAVYLYSYAKNLAGNESIQSEIEHCKRLLSEVPVKPFCVYIDMEDDSTTYLGKLMLTNYALEFCKQMTSAGYKAGVYANQNWFKNYLNVKKISDQGYSIWCAKYSVNKPNIDASYDIWQYSSTGSVDGISSNVDMNEMYSDIRGTVTNPTTLKSVNEIAQEVINGQWGNGEDRKNRLTSAGYDYNVVQSKVNELMGTTNSYTTYTVVSGDTLSGIANRYGTTYQALARYNGISNPDKINVGQVIKIPSDITLVSNKEYYVVKSGDNLSTIAKKYGTTVSQLQSWNNIANANLIYPNQKLRVR